MLIDLLITSILNWFSGLCPSQSVLVVIVTGFGSTLLGTYKGSRPDVGHTD